MTKLWLPLWTTKQKLSVVAKGGNVVIGSSVYHLNLKMLDLSFYLGFSCLPFAIWLQVHYLTANLTIFQFKMCIFAR